MTEELREALHETAELGQTANIPDTLWADAQRARRRDRVVLPVISLLVIAGLGAGLGVLTQTRHQAAPADGDDLGVPSHIYGMTADSENGGWGYQGLPPEADDFHVGTAAALLRGDSGWVVVSAKDGGYHRLRGPSSSFDDSEAALAPQGDRVAWSPGGKVGGVLRITVADLTTGGLKRYPIPEAVVPAGARDLFWSANGRYLAFRTSEQGGDSFRLYVLDTRTGDVSSRTAWGDTVVPLAATDDGGVSVIWDGAVRTWLPRRGVLVGSSSDIASSMAISTDGSLVAMSEFRTGNEQSTEPQVIWFLDADSDAASGFGREVNASGEVRILGWTPDDQVVVTAMKPDSSRTAELILLDIETSKSKVVGTIDSIDIEQVQVATALMASGRPTVDRDEPSWVDHDFPWWRTYGISLVLGLLLLAVVNIRRRRMAG